MMFVLTNGICITSRDLLLLIVAHGGNLHRYGNRLFRYDQPVPANIAAGIRRYLTPNGKLNKLGREVVMCKMDYTYLINENQVMEVAA